MKRFEPLIEMLPLESLQPASRNARTHSDRQIEQLAESMRQFGFTSPILIDENRRIIAGHGRAQAAHLMGLEHVPTIRLSHLSQDQKRALALADNKLALNAGWDAELLAAELTELGELDFDLPVLGFSQDELDTIFADAQAADPTTPDSDLDAVPPLPRTPSTKMGDVWRLGRHFLLCGDARDATAIKDLLRGEQADIIFTDPPYNVPIDGHVCGSGRIRHREFAMGVGEMTSAEFIDFLVATLGPAAACCRDGAIAFACMDWRHAGELTAAGAKVFSELKNVCVWNKKNAGMGTFYRSKHELVFVFKVGSAAHINNFGLGDKGRYRTNVWDYPGVTSSGAAGLKDLAMHPTVKPVSLIVDALRDCSNRGAIVLDVFGGSGSTLIAAHQCGRTARLVEIDPHYCDVIVARFEAITGRRGELV